jgi:hypothetical protein
MLTLTRNKQTRPLALETLEWIGIGVVLIITAVLAYTQLGGQIAGWVAQVAGAI